MSVKRIFMDNEEYGADDINLMMSRLTTQGVSLFQYSDGDNPLLSLNSALANYTGSGIEMFDTDACKVIYDSVEDKFKILTGTAFMSDGSAIIIDTDPYDITDEVEEIRRTDNGDIYVYFKRNIGENTIDIAVTTDDSDAGNTLCVPLATISGESSIADTRKISASKVASCGANIIKDVTVTVPRLNNTDEPERHLITTVENVFPGASRVIMRYYNPNDTIGSVTICDIQTENGQSDEDLEYTEIESYYHSQVAFNRIGCDLQIWMKVGYTYISERTYLLTIC